MQGSGPGRGDASAPEDDKKHGVDESAPDLARGAMPASPDCRRYVETAAVGAALDNEGMPHALRQGAHDACDAGDAEVEGPEPADVKMEARDRAEQWHGPEHPLVQEGRAGEAAELAEAVAGATEAELAQGKCARASAMPWSAHGARCRQARSEG